MDHLKTLTRLPWTNTRYRRGKLRKMAQETLCGTPPAQPRDWLQQPVMRELAAAYDAAAAYPPYFGGQVTLAILCALLFLSCGMSLLYAAQHGDFTSTTMLYMRLSAAGILVLAGVSMWAAFAKNWGPQSINGQSHARCFARQRASLDHQVHPNSLLGDLFLLAVVVGDGVLAGTAILGWFKSMFTAQAATALAFGWGAIVGGVLWKLTSAAADEARVVAVRRMVRQLDASTHPVDRNRVGVFMAEAGTRIGLDLGAQRPITWRVMLLVGVLALGSATAFMRVSSSDRSKAEPAQVNSPADMSAADGADTAADATGQAAGGKPQNATTAGTNGWLSSVLMSFVLLMSAAVLYWRKSRTCLINLKDGPGDAAVMARFPDAESAELFNLSHKRRVLMALDLKLQQFSRQFDRAKQALPPSEQRNWPPCQVRAVDLLMANSAPQMTFPPLALGN